MNKGILVEKMIKSKVLGFILWIIFLVGSIFVILTTPFNFPNVFIDPSYFSNKVVIGGIIGGILNIIGIISMLISILLIFIIKIKRGKQKNV